MEEQKWGKRNEQEAEARRWSGELCGVSQKSKRREKWTQQRVQARRERKRWGEARTHEQPKKAKGRKTKKEGRYEGRKEGRKGRAGKAVAPRLVPSLQDLIRSPRFFFARSCHRLGPLFLNFFFYFLFDLIRTSSSSLLVLLLPPHSLLHQPPFNHNDLLHPHQPGPCPAARPLCRLGGPRGRLLQRQGRSRPDAQGTCPHRLGPSLFLFLHNGAVSPHSAQRKSDSPRNACTISTCSLLSGSPINPPSPLS